MSDVLGKEWDNNVDREIMMELTLCPRCHKEPCDCGKGITGAEILQKEDGLWLAITTKSSGNWALIHLNNLAYRLGPITGDILLNWAEENMKEAE